MVRITRCPVCSKINKIKHEHYTNFVCCSIKFPITEYQINKIPQNPLKEPECEAEDLEVEECDEKPKKEIIEERPNPDDYDFRCSECNELFNEEGNRNFLGGIKCPDCGLTNYGL